LLLEAPDDEPLGSPKRPSVFASQDRKDLDMLSRYYKPNIFAWTASGDAGVMDDVSELQLRCAIRLRARQQRLNAADLDQVRQLHRREMEDVDAYVEGFDAYAAPAPPPRRPSNMGGAGPLPPSAGPAFPSLNNPAWGAWPPGPAAVPSWSSALPGRRTPSEYLDELLRASPHGYATAVRHLAAAEAGPPGFGLRRDGLRAAAGPAPL